MNFRKLKNEFKNEIYKEDVLKVLKNGIITMLLYSVLMGLVNVVLILIFNIQTSLLIYFIGLFIARSVKESYYNRHILYPLLSVVFLLVGLYIFNSVSLFAYNRTFELSYFLLSFEHGFYDTIQIFNPLYYINEFSINNLLFLLIVVYTIYLTYRNSKNNYF
ncbi:MAG: hypothetical protein R3Y60_04835 [bacterium]